MSAFPRLFGLFFIGLALSQCEAFTVSFPANPNIKVRFTMDLDEYFAAQSYSISPSNIGVLSQPINPLNSSTVDTQNANLLSLSMFGSAYRVQAFKAVGFMLDSQSVVYKSQNTSEFDGIVPIPSFYNFSKVAVPSGQTGFSCTDLATMVSTYAVACKFYDTKQKSESTVLYIYDIDNGDSPIGSSVELYYGQTSIDTIELVYNAETTSMSQTLFALFTEEYIIVYNVADPTKPISATVIDSGHVGQSFSPVAMHVYDQSIVVLSLVQGEYYVVKLNVEGYYEFAVDYAVKLSNVFGIENSIQILENAAYFVSSGQIIRFDLKAKTYTTTTFSSTAVKNPAICGSGNFLNVIYWSQSNSTVNVISYVSQEGGQKLTFYSENYFQSGSATEYTFQYDHYNDVLYLAFGQTLSLIQIGRPSYVVDKAVDQNVTLSIYYWTLGQERPLLADRQQVLSFQVVDTERDYSFFLPYSLDTTFTTGGAFTFPLAYPLIFYGTGLRYRAGPMAGIDFLSNNSYAIPRVKINNYETLDPVLFNVNPDNFFFYGQIKQFTLQNNEANVEIPEQFLQFHFGQLPDLGFQTWIYGCTKGGKLTSSIICSAKYSVNHTSGAIDYRVIQGGFAIVLSNSQFAFYKLYESSPYLTIQPSQKFFSSNCDIAYGMALICVNQNGEIDTYIISGSDSSDVPVSTITQTVYNATMVGKSIKASYTLPGAVAITTSNTIFIYNFTDPSNPFHIGTVDHFYVESLECLMFTEKNIVAVATEETNGQYLTSMHVYQVAKNLAGLLYYERSFSYSASYLLFSSSSISESTNTVYFSTKSFTTYALNLGTGMSGLNNPILIDNPVVIQSCILNIDGDDFFIPTSTSSSANHPLKIYFEPSVTMYPQLQTLELDVYSMPSELRIYNEIDKTDVHTFNVTLANSRVYPLVDSEGLDKIKMEVKDNKVVDIVQSGIFDKSAILFYYLKAENEDDIGLRIEIENAVTKDNNYSLFASTSDASTVLDIKHSQNGNITTMQGKKTLFLVDTNTQKLQTSVNIDLPEQSSHDPSFYCLAASYWGSKSASLCHGDGDYYWVVFYSYAGSMPTKYGSYFLTGDNYYQDIFMYEDIVVIQGVLELFLYRVVLDYSTYELTLKYIDHVYNIRDIEYAISGSKIVFLGISQTGIVTHAFYDKTTKQLSSYRSRDSIYDTLYSNGYTYFYRHTTTFIGGHVCKIGYNSTLSSSIKTNCVVFAEIGDIDISLDFDSSSNSLDIRFYGAYMPLGTYKGIAGVLTENYMVTLAERQHKWVYQDGVEVPLNPFNVLVYKRIPANATEVPLNFTMASAQLIIGGVPCPSFMVDNGFVPKLETLSRADLGATDDQFILSSNQFQKILKFNVTGKSLIKFKETSKIKSKEFTLVGYNGYVFAQSTKNLGGSSLTWLWILLVFLLVVIVLGVGVFLGCFLLSKAGTRITSDTDINTTSEKSITSRLTSE